MKVFVIITFLMTFFVCAIVQGQESQWQFSLAKLSNEGGGFGGGFGGGRIAKRSYGGHGAGRIAKRSYGGRGGPILSYRGLGGRGGKR